MHKTHVMLSGTQWSFAKTAKKAKHLGEAAIDINMKQYFVYILTNHENKTLYIGVTDNITRLLAV